MMYSNRLGPKHFPTCQESNQVYPPLHLYILPPSQAEGIPSPPFAGPKMEIFKLLSDLHLSVFLSFV